jgi:hypothetical protein
MGVALLVSGCWSPPSASVRPGGRARAIAGAIEIESVGPSARILTVSAAVNGRTPQARVLLVDPSYRLLTVQYPNGRMETFKIRLHTRIGDIEAGDAVTIRPAEVVERAR